MPNKCKWCGRPITRPNASNPVRGFYGWYCGMACIAAVDDWIVKEAK